MGFVKLKKLIDLVEEAGITELEVTEGEEKVRIVKQAYAVPQQTFMVPQAAPLAAPASKVSSVNRMTRTKKMNRKAKSSNRQWSARSTARPARVPTASVEIGSQVKAGDTLCIVVASRSCSMKSNPTAPVRSKPSWSKNGQPVEYGEPLFIIG